MCSETPFEKNKTNDGQTSSSGGVRTGPNAIVEAQTGPCWTEALQRVSCLHLERDPHPPDDTIDHLMTIVELIDAAGFDIWALRCNANRERRLETVVGWSACDGFCGPGVPVDPKNICFEHVWKRLEQAEIVQIPPASGTGKTNGTAAEAGLPCERGGRHVFFPIRGPHGLQGILRVQTKTNAPADEQLLTWGKTAANMIGAFLQARRDRVELAESQDLVRLVFDSMSSGVMVTDGDGVVLLANPAAVACLEIPRTELLRSRLADRLAGGKALLQNTRAGEQRTAEIKVGPQRIKTVGFTSSRLSDQDHRVTVFRDLTPILEMQRRQRRAEQLAQVGEMAARLSHEIKNPLSSILAGLELLEKKTLLSFSQNAVLQSVCEEARALSEVVGELLRAARPAPMQPRLCRLGRTLYDAVEPLLDFAANHGIAVEIKPPQGDFCVAVDVQALGRVIRNLLVNAVEATAPGGRVLICWGAIDESEKKELFSGFSATVVKITVRDDGAGIPADLVERIFEPFCTTKENGTGLGLAVALDVVENHGGVMTVDSTCGVETAFSIYLTAGPRSSCWEHETACRQSCASCPVRETSLGFCCWAIKGEGIWAETHHWPHLCQRCVYFRRYNLQAHFRR